MLLEKLKLHNFRQFLGIQEIDFAMDADQKNVTVVFGENGRGKTGIFRAIMFCLYGDRLISQDERIDESEIKLVNLQALQQAEPQEPVDSFVELEFSHHQIQYVLTRKLLGMLTEHGEQIEEISSVNLVRKEPKGNSKIITNDMEINDEIKKVLDRGLKDYFLFDGEKIERLTRASKEQRKEISSAIRNLLNVNALERSVAALTKLVKQFEADLKNTSHAELAQILLELSRIEDKLLAGKEDISNIDEEISHAEEEKQSLDQELDKYKEIGHLVQRRKDYLEVIEKSNKTKASLLGEMKSQLAKSSILLVSETILEVYKHLCDMKEKGEIPPEIRKELIERIISDEVCICGRELIKGTTEYKCIQAWKQRTSDVVMQDMALQLWHQLGIVDKSIDDIVNSTQSLLIQYANTRNDIEEYEEKLNVISEQIGGSERSDIGDLERQRTSVEIKLRHLEAKKQNLESNQKTLNNERSHQIDQKSELEKEVSMQDEITGRAITARKVRDALETVHDEFTKEIRLMISKLASELFVKLLDAQGREMLHEIAVKDDYSLELLDRWHSPFLANISAGQRQIMSISLIAALAKLAAKNNVFEMPFFMDTPFGRLSHDHRKNLIFELPKICSQWILLATDTEFGRSEAKDLKASGKWGKFYILKAVEGGATQIKPIAVEKSGVYLRNTEVPG